MRSTETTLTDVRVAPYFKGLPVEVEPLALGGVGTYVQGELLDAQYFRLILECDGEGSGLQVGVPYACSGQAPGGQRIQTHWLYCVALSPQIEFGLTRDWREADSFAPLLPGVREPLVRLEEICELVAVFSAPPPAVGVAQAKIGQRGWLVSSTVTTPHRLGVLVDGPSLPPMVTEGAEDIAVSAKVERTMQTIGFSSLTCAAASEGALLLWEK